MVARGGMEGDTFDFKLSLPEAETLTKICCAFANTNGGFLVLGVGETGRRFEIKGIENDKELATRFGQRIRAEPTIYFKLPKILEMPGSEKVLAVFHVPQSNDRPHAPSNKEKAAFWKRTNSGCEQMTYEEIRGAFLGYEGRREKLRLLYVELVFNSRLVREMLVPDQQAATTYSLLTLDPTVINGLMADIFPLIGRDKELVDLLYKIRKNIYAINNQKESFFQQIAVPRSNGNAIIREHNAFILNNARFLLGELESAAGILENRFGVNR